jgi:hypothetical protein
MAGVDLRTVAELMGHSSIQMTMRYAHLAPQHNRAAVDRLVPAVKLSRKRKKRTGVAKSENELVTKSVTSRKQISETSVDVQNKAHEISKLQTWPCSSGG